MVLTVNDVRSRGVYCHIDNILNLNKYLSPVSLRQRYCSMLVEYTRVVNTVCDFMLLLSRPINQMGTAPHFTDMHKSLLTNQLVS